LAAWGSVQKVSNLIRNINVYMRNVRTGTLHFANSVDIRGNTDEAWRRGLDYMLRHYLFSEPRMAFPIRAYLLHTLASPRSLGYAPLRRLKASYWGRLAKFGIKQEQTISARLSWPVLARRSAA
jgi:hypothetical protein